MTPSAKDDTTIPTRGKAKADQTRVVEEHGTLRSGICADRILKRFRVTHPCSEFPEISSRPRVLIVPVM